MPFTPWMAVGILSSNARMYLIGICRRQASQSPHNVTRRSPRCAVQELHTAPPHPSTAPPRGPGGRARLLQRGRLGGHELIRRSQAVRHVQKGQRGLRSQEARIAARRQCCRARREPHQRPAWPPTAAAGPACARARRASGPAAAARSCCRQTLRLGRGDALELMEADTAERRAVFGTVLRGQATLHGGP